MKRTFKHLRNKAYTYTAILTLLAATLNPGMTAYADEPGEAAGTESSNSSESSSSSEGSSSSESGSSSSEGGSSSESSSSSSEGGSSSESNSSSSEGGSSSESGSSSSEGGSSSDNSSSTESSSESSSEAASDHESNDDTVSGDSESTGTGAEENTDNTPAENTGDGTPAAEAAQESILESNENIEITTNEDSSVNIIYSETISDIETETGTIEIVEEKTIEQEEIKREIEEQNGTYEYTVETEKNVTTEKKTIDAESKEEAESKAADLNGEVITTETTVEKTAEQSFDTLEAAQGFIESIEETNTVIEATITVTEEQIESGLTAQLVDEKGYHMEDNGDGTYSIIITGGLEEITIDFAGFNEVWEPGDSITTSFRIINESGDEYEVVNYRREAEGPFRFIRTARYDESLGEKVGELNGGAYTYYKPNVVTKINGTSYVVGPYDEVTKWYNKKYNTNIRWDAEKYIDDSVLLEYYNEVLDAHYDNIYDAWYANFNERLWKNSYNGVSGEEFFNNIDLTTDTPVDVTFHASIDGPGTDNVYMNTVWGFFEDLVIRIVDKIIPASYTAKVEYEDTEYSYSVEYDEIKESYTVNIEGQGSIPAAEVIIHEKPADPAAPRKSSDSETTDRPEDPKEENPVRYEAAVEIKPVRKAAAEHGSSERTEYSADSVKENVIIYDNPIPMASGNETESAVLGVSRSAEQTMEEPAVLGVSRAAGNDKNEAEVLGAARLPQTGQTWWPIPVMMIAGWLLICSGLKQKREED